MYRMVKAVGLDGVNKLPDIAARHSLEGELIEMPYVGGNIWFEYDDDSGKVMRSSTIWDVQYVGEQIRIETRNSKYWFERIGD